MVMPNGALMRTKTALLMRLASRLELAIASKGVGDRG